MAASTAPLTVNEQIQQLNAARRIVLENAAYYEKIVQGILPIIGPSSPMELRRWGAEFLAESLATPAVPARDKDNLTVSVLETLRGLLEGENEDRLVLRVIIMAAASAYPAVMRWIVHNPHDTQSWQHITAIKARILSLWDGAIMPVKICCIKFVQRVVLAQTASNGGEMKAQGLDVSLNMIAANHSLLDARYLEAEATGLLDRMLGVLQDSGSDALLVVATLNSLSILIRTRPSTSGRIVNCVLCFNPLKLANSLMTPKTKVLIKSMEKTTRMLLLHLVKRDPNNPMAGRIQQHVEKLMRSRAEILDEVGKKRAMGQQAVYAEAKRQKTEAAPATVSLPVIQTLPPAPKSLAALFTFTSHIGLQTFDAKQVPAPLAARVSVRVLGAIDQQVLDLAIKAVRERLRAAWVEAQVDLQSQAINPDTVPLGVDEDDDDYEPDFYPAEDTEQILNKLDNAPPEAVNAPDANALAPLGAFNLPPPPQLDPDIAARLSQVVASRVFGPLGHVEDSARKSKAGINRLAASAFDRDAWLTLITRLATRATYQLDDKIKDEDANLALDRSRVSVGSMIREHLYHYVLEDFRRRIDVAVSWLCEEWYNDQLTKRSRQDGLLYYEKYALRLVDGFLPYLNAQDKVLTRFLAEIPDLSRALLGRVKLLCRDPTTIQLALTSLLYLVMMKPPAKEFALDTVEGIWIEYEDARPLAAKYLSKWRPGFIESQTGAA